MEEELPDASGAMTPVRRHRISSAAHRPGQACPFLKGRDRMLGDPAGGLLGDTAVSIVSRCLEEVEEGVRNPGGAVGVSERRFPAEIAIAGRNLPTALARTSCLASL